MENYSADEKKKEHDMKRKEEKKKSRKDCAKNGMNSCNTKESCAVWPKRIISKGLERIKP